MARIDAVAVHDLRMPLAEPYPSAIATIEALEALVVEVRLDDGRSGFGEAAIVEGYTHETREGGWQFCREHGQAAVSRDSAEVKRALAAHRAEHSHAVATLVSALEMAEGNAFLAPPMTKLRVPLLAPVNSKQQAAIAAEVDRLLTAGFRTLKVKVGFDVEADLARVRFIRKVVAGRALLRLDGNQGFSREQATKFVSSLEPDGIELLEQPCADHDWEAAAALARIAPVPMMLDESIYASTDIDRARDLEAATYIKLKLAKAGGVDALAADLERITACGMKRVLGNGVASEIGCWMEACLAARYIDNAGEMNGYLKPRDRLFADPLPFADGAIEIPAGYVPRLDERAVASASIRTERFGRTRVHA